MKSFKDSFLSYNQMTNYVTYFSTNLDKYLHSVISLLVKLKLAAYVS